MYIAEAIDFRHLMAKLDGKAREVMYYILICGYRGVFEQYAQEYWGDKAVTLRMYRDWLINDRYAIIDALGINKDEGVKACMACRKEQGKFCGV